MRVAAEGRRSVSGWKRVVAVESDDGFGLGWVLVSGVADY